MNSEDSNPINGTQQPDPHTTERPKEQPLPHETLTPEVCAFLDDFAIASRAAIMDAFTKLPARTQHMPMFVLMKIIAELSYAYWPNVGARMWDDMVSEAVQRMAQFTLLTPQAVAKWKLEAENHLLEEAAKVIDKPLIILPGGDLAN